MTARNAGALLLGVCLAWSIPIGGISLVAAADQPAAIDFPPILGEEYALYQPQTLPPNQSDSSSPDATPLQEEASAEPEPLELPEPDDRPAKSDANVHEPVPEAPGSSRISLPERVESNGPYRILEPEPVAQPDVGEYWGDDEYVDGDYVVGDYFDAIGCRPTKWWIRADYLLGWTNGSRVPPLATTSTLAGPYGINDAPGALDQPDTTILFGGKRVNNRNRSNGRYSLGYWFDPCHSAGVEGDYYSLGGQSTNLTLFSTGRPPIFRPFFDVNPENPPGIPNPFFDDENTQIIVYPNVTAGSIDIRTRDYFESAGIRWRRTLVCWEPVCCPTECGEECVDECGSCGDFGCDFRYVDRRVKVDLLAGYRYNRLTDSVTIRENIAIINLPPLAAGTTIDLEDSFRATNEFHGAELGLLTQVYRGRWSFEFLAKMAIGNNRQVVTIAGTQTISDPVAPPPVNRPYGFYALPTNIGRYTRNDFVVIPQFQAELSYRVTERLRAYVGYNFLYWANVSRAGEAIDRSVNFGLATGQHALGATRPAFAFSGSDFWAQGMTLGVELNF